MKEADKIKIELYKLIYKQYKNNYIAVPEISLPNNVADIVLFNGDITIYEIKSKSDSLKRFENQIESYRRFANYVYAVVDERFLIKIQDDESYNDIGLIKVTSKYKLVYVREPKFHNIKKENYLTYWSPIEARESLRGFPRWYDYSTNQAFHKLLEILTEEEMQKVTLFRVREKYLEESNRRKQAVKEKEFETVLNCRFRNLDSLTITPLREIPVRIFKEFD